MEHPFKPTEEERAALAYHASTPRGKTATTTTKPLNTRHDLAMAYTPGVAAPSRAIAADPRTINHYTNRGNLVAIITNGTALLGLGDTGPSAAKPVMEGKAMLLKQLARIDSFDIEIDERDPDRLVAIIRAVAPGFGAILLEDIKAPECFYIEERLRESLAIPVLHDDQHGTAVVVAAAVINAAKLVGKPIESLRTVICGAGAAAIASARMLLRLGIRRDRLIACDSQGVINDHRPLVPDYKRQFATARRIHTLAEAMVDADLVVGASSGDLLNEQMVRSMATNPIILALANPTPELLPEKAATARPDLIYATGRSDLDNQVNNALAMPYLFRAALDCEAREINEQMLLAAAHEIARLAEEAPPQTSDAHHANHAWQFGRNYLLPKLLDERLPTRVTQAVIQAAVASGAAQKGMK